MREDEDMFNRIKKNIIPVLIIGCSVIAVNTSYAQDKPSTKMIFETLDQKGEKESIVTLFKENPADAVFVMDSYLEGALALYEEGSASDIEIQSMFEQGLRAAKAADTAFNRRIFTDYAASFSGWNDSQKKQFRKGQKLYKEARKALSQKELEKALLIAEESRMASEPIGDWWGAAAAMALTGAAQRQLGNNQAALDSFGRARIIFQAFGMEKKLISTEIEMGRTLIKLQANLRAKVTLESALIRAQKAGDIKSEKSIKPLLLDL